MTKPTASNVQYTPGPWHAADCVYRLDRENREFIGIGNGACHVGYASITCAVRLAEAKANARLIAAAPELVEALRESLKEMEAFRAYWTSPNMGLKRGVCRAEELARTALALVDGK